MLPNFFNMCDIIYECSLRCDLGVTPWHKGYGGVTEGGGGLATSKISLGNLGLVLKLKQHKLFGLFY